MTIDEAIKILSDANYGGTFSTGLNFREAIELSIEALKRCRTLAQNSPLWAAKPLPGETEE